MNASYHARAHSVAAFVPYQIRTPRDDGFHFVPRDDADRRGFCRKWWAFLGVDEELLPRTIDPLTPEGREAIDRTEARVAALKAFCEEEVFRRKYHPSLGDMHALLCSVSSGEVSRDEFNTIMGGPASIQAVASAEAIAVAIDCLPIGADIRERLNAHVQEHITLLRRISGDLV